MIFHADFFRIPYFKIIRIDRNSREEKDSRDLGFVGLSRSCFRVSRAGALVLDFESSTTLVFVRPEIPEETRDCFRSNHIP